MDTKPINPNSLKTSTEELNDPEKIRIANGRLRDLSEFVAPAPGLEYMGSCAIHIYSRSGITNPIFFVASQFAGNGLTEDAMITGLTVLRDESMKRFGRTPPRKRKDL